MNEHNRQITTKLEITIYNDAYCYYKHIKEKLKSDCEERIEKAIKKKVKSSSG